MKCVPAFLLCFISVISFTQEDTIIGKKSPDLTFDQMVNYHMSEATLSDFDGKIVVLDFWATWCIPCIQSFPKLEELQHTFQDYLQIITITDDPPGRIERFLNKQQMSLPVVIDEKRSLAKIFPHRTIPHAIVIDKTGTVRAITTSSEITKELIEKLISGKEIHLDEKKEDIHFDPSKPLSGNENFTYQITITPFRDGYPSMVNPTGGEGSYKGRRIIATNLAAKSLIEIACQFPVGTRTIMDVEDKSRLEWNRQNAICFDLIVPEELGEKRFDIMRMHLELYFGLEAVIEERVMPAKILQRLHGSTHKPEKAEGDLEPYAAYGGRGLSMKNSPISTLCNFLEGQLNKPLVDETHLPGKYNMEVPWYHENPEQIHAELKNFGLELVDGERKIKVLVLREK